MRNFFDDTQVWNVLIACIAEVRYLYIGETTSRIHVWIIRPQARSALFEKTVWYVQSSTMHKLSAELALSPLALARRGPMYITR